MVVEMQAALAFRAWLVVLEPLVAVVAPSCALLAHQELAVPVDAALVSALVEEYYIPCV